MDEIMCGLVYKQKAITTAALNISLNFKLLNQVKELVARFTSLFGICAAHISFVSRQRGMREVWPSILNISLNFKLLNQVKELVARFTSLFGICAAHISFVSRQHGMREVWPSIYCLGMHETPW